jgi:RNA-splicing ligase RtcB
MFIIKGKYNIAKIMLSSEEQLDDNTREQIQKFVNQPMFKGNPIVIMPDCHTGIGSCIGYTQVITDYLIPNIVGVDIGCGVESYNLGDIDVDVEALDNYIKRTVPA